MSASSRGSATTSGGFGNSRCRPRHTSRNDLPYVWPARSSGSSVQIAASDAGGATRGARRSSSATVGGSMTRRSPVPKRDAIVRASFWCCSGLGPAPSMPQPQKRRLPTSDVGVALVDERLAQLVAVAREVELEGEALLEAVRTLHVDGVDHVQRFLRPAHDERALLRDYARDLERGVEQLVARHDLLDGPEREQLLRGDRRAGEVHGAQLVGGNEAREVRRDTERTAVDLGHTERRIVGRDHDVGVAGDADAATEAVTVDRRDDRDFAVVDRGERLVAAAVDRDHRLVRRVGGELLDVDAALEALALGVHDQRPHGGVTPRVTDRL